MPMSDPQSTTDTATGNPLGQDRPDTAPDASSDELSLLKQQLADAESRAAQARDAQMRALAEVDNIRKRAERDIAAGLKFGNEKLLGDLLSVADSLELGLQAARAPDARIEKLVEGMTLTHRQLGAALEKYGAVPIDPAGQPFDPNLHEAVSTVAVADVPPNQVVSVMQKGYRLHDRLLRPAVVMVSRG